MFVRAFRANGGTPVAVGFLVLTTVAVMIVTNKTLSPQYLLWLGGPAAALLLLRNGARSDERIAIRRTAYALLVLALLTHLVYPTLYNGLLGRRGEAMIVVATVVTALRNVALLAFAGYVGTPGLALPRRRTALQYRWMIKKIGQGTRPAELPARPTLGSLENAHRARSQLWAQAG